MYWLRVRTFSKFFNSSSLSVHFDQSTRQLRSKSLTTTLNEYQKEKRKRDTRLMKRLQNIALCMYTNKVALMNLHDNLDKNDLLNDKWRDSSKLSSQSKKFLDEILKTIEDSVLEYKNSLEEKNSFSDETDSTSCCSSDWSSSDSDSVSDSSSDFDSDSDSSLNSDSDSDSFSSSDDDFGFSDTESEDGTISDRYEKIFEESSQDDFDYKIMMLYGI